jgi:drug/metabolite transporter (DMT)-like permease
VIAGVGFFGAYALVLAALSIAPAAPVAAVRETSILIAAAVLAITGRERLSIGRIVGSAAVVAGIACIALG